VMAGGGLNDTYVG